MTVDHETIRLQMFVERYARGELPPELETDFEAHLMGCSECQDLLEEEFRFAAAFRQLGAEQLVAGRRHPRPWMSREFWWGAAAAAVVLAAALPLLLTLFQPRVSPAPELWTGTGEAGPEAPASSEAPQVAGEEVGDPSTGAAGAADVAELRARLARLEDELARLRTPSPSLPIYFLETPRGGELGAEGLVIPWDPHRDWVILAVDVFEATSRQFHAVLRSDEGRSLWESREPLRQVNHNILTILVPAAMLPPGGYFLELQEITAGGPRPYQTFRFTVQAEK